MMKNSRGLPGVAGAALLSFAVSVAGQNHPDGPKFESGLRVTFAAPAGDRPVATDAAILPNVWLYVPAGASPTPFLPGGKFTAVWEGFVSSELRENYTFQAALNGGLKMEINGAPVWDAGGQGELTEPSKSIRLNKGTNAFKLIYTAPASGDAFVRLSWSSVEFLMEPMALSALSHDAGAPDVQQAKRIRLGRELFVEFRCAKCHAVAGAETGMPELAMDAPSFEGIGSRRNRDWMARWILDPKAQRPTAHMPRLLRGAGAKEDAEAVAVFLVSLQSGSATAELKEPEAGLEEPGKRLFDTLHCAACHIVPGVKETDATKISLQHVRAKFASGGLGDFLRKPEEHFAWIRMPNFRLTAEETDQLAAWLNAAADPPAAGAAPNDPATRERGKKLVQTTGCLNCHPLQIENQFTASRLADLSAEKWNQGCLAEEPGEGSKAPWFGFTASEREALRAFAMTDRTSLGRHVPAEFAERYARRLNCRECHGRFEGVPAFEVLGGKLKPEWMTRFVAGEVAYKPRPWLDARMPSFPKYADGLARGLVIMHGLPPQTPAEPPVDPESAKAGRKLVSVSGGFSCVACHGVGALAAMQVFEAPGINLVHSGERLQKSYFHRWLRSPLRVEPTTKMPVYFDNEGRSPLTDVYDGDGGRQIEAIWQYLRLGDKMPSPTGAQ